MTGDVGGSPTANDSSTEVANAPPQSDTKPAQQSQKDTSTERTETENPSKASGGGGWAWGFDVNTVAGNIGGLFGAGKDDSEEDGNDGNDRNGEGDGDTDRSVNTPADELGKTAANLANAATAELEIASKAAQETFGKAAEELGKGWGNFNTFLDDMLASKPDGDTHNEDNIHTLFHATFPELGKEDEVVDHFRCVLLQKYRCYLNNATPEKSFPLRGRLFVSTIHIAMYVTDDGGQFGGKPFGIVIPLKDVGKIQKGATSMLRLVTKEQASYIFAEFESDSHFSGALSLLEHMTAASGPQASPDSSESPENKDTTLAS